MLFCIRVPPFPPPDMIQNLGLSLPCGPFMHRGQNRRNSKFLVVDFQKPPHALKFLVPISGTLAHAHTRACMHARMHARVHPSTCAGAQARTRASIHACTRTQVRTQVRTHVRAQACTRACTHAHTLAGSPRICLSHRPPAPTPSTQICSRIKTNAIWKQ
jgi:hypothetical protein